MPPAPYQLITKRCKAGYRRDVKGGTMCNPKPGYTPKVATKKPATPRARKATTAPSVRARDATTGRFVKAGSVVLPPGFAFKKKQSPMPAAMAKVLALNKGKAANPYTHTQNPALAQIDDIDD